jgi:hypothetical protein
MSSTSTHPQHSPSSRTVTDGIIQPTGRIHIVNTCTFLPAATLPLIP